MKKWYVTGGRTETGYRNDTIVPPLVGYGEDALSALIETGLTVWSEEKWVAHLERNTMTATVYLHGEREQMYDTGKKLGLTGEALSMFSYACYEVKVELRVNQTTGQATITHIDGRVVADV